MGGGARCSYLHEYLAIFGWLYENQEGILKWPGTIFFVTHLESKNKNTLWSPNTRVRLQVITFDHCWVYERVAVLARSTSMS